MGVAVRVSQALKVQRSPGERLKDLEAEDARARAGRWRIWRWRSRLPGAPTSDLWGTRPRVTYADLSG